MIGNWINYIIFVVLLIVGILFYNSGILVISTIIVCILPFISYVLFRRNRNKLNIYVENIPDSVGRKNDIAFDICVDNMSMYPFGNIIVKVDVENIFYGNKTEYQVSLPNVLKHKRKVRWSVASKYAGNIKVCLSEIEVQDAMFLFRKEIKIKDEHIVKVFTEYDMVNFDNAVFLDGEGEEQETLYKKGTDVSEISDIREYAPGDSMQSIHWKLSARRDEMLVKEYSMPYSTKMFVYIDLHMNSYVMDEMDVVIEAYMAVCSAIISSGHVFDTAWYDRNNGGMIVNTINNSEDLQRVMYDMFYAEPAEGIHEMYDVFINTFGNSFNTIYVTGKSSENIVKGERMAEYKNKAVIIKV